jgi:uncharacterized protein (TIRG00374 family)
LIGIVLAAGGLWIFFRDVDLYDLWVQLKSYNPFVIVLCAVLPALSLWLRSVRLGLILPASPNSTKKKLFDLVMIEYAINNVLPGRTGDAARGVLLWHRNGFSAGVAIGSVLVERIIDVLMTFAFFFLPVFLLPSLQNARIPLRLGSIHGHLSLWVMGVLACGFALFSFSLFLLYSRHPIAAKALVKEVLAFLPISWHRHTSELAAGVGGNLRWLFSWRRSGAVFVLSIGIEACYAASFFLLVGPFNLTGIVHSLFLQAFGALGTIIPLAPGYIGTLEASLLLGTTLLGVEGSRARASIILYHAIGFIAVTPLGIYYVLKRHVPFKDISKARDEL